VATALRPFALAGLAFLIAGTVAVLFSTTLGLILIGFGVITGLLMCQAYGDITQAPVLSDRLLVALALAVLGLMGTAIAAALTR
jgi:hypothetical protein